MPCSSENIPQAWNLSHDNPLFIGRESILQRMDSFFNHQKGKILALTGGPGFGKTQIAKKYAQQFYKKYDLVWWVDAQQDLYYQFEKLAEELNRLLPFKEQIVASGLSKEALVTLIKNILRVKKINYLLIFDNAETYDQIEPFIPCAHLARRKHVLMTSRNANIWLNKVEVGKFKREESIKLVKIGLAKESNKAIENLASILEDYPLGLAIAVAFVKTHPTANIEKYISLYLEKRITPSQNNPQFISGSSPLLDRYTHDVHTALSITLKFIEKQSPDALNVLFFMSLLNSKDIPEKYIEIWLDQSKSKFNVLEILKPLYDQSMIEINAPSKNRKKQMMNNKISGSFISLHDLIHQTVNDKISDKDKKIFLEKAAKVMGEIFSSSPEALVKMVLAEPVHLLHARILCENAKKLNYSSPQLLKLKVCILECLMSGLREFKTAKSFLEDIGKDLKAGFELEPYYKGLFKINQGFFEASYNANYNKAIDYMSESLDIFKSSLQYKEESLRAVSNLMQYYAVRGECAKAERAMKKGNVLSKNSKSVAYNCFFIYASAFILNDQGKFGEAEEILRKVEAYPNLKTEYQTIEHAILLQKVVALIKQRKIAEAQKYLRSCEMSISEFYQGRKNTSVANVPLCKALVLVYKNCDPAKILELLSRSLEIYTSFLQNDKKHRNQGLIHLTMGKAYAMQKAFGQALEEYRLSEQIYHAVLKEQAIDDVSDLYKELAILGAKINDEELTRKYLKAHIATFGIAHKRTKEIMFYLDRHKAQIF